jgi:hypothetical protein
MRYPAQGLPALLELAGLLDKVGELGLRLLRFLFEGIIGQCDSMLRQIRGQSLDLVGSDREFQS